MPETIYSWAPITKSEKQDDGTLLVYGPAATSALDRDRQRLDASWLDAAMPRWMAEGGGVREQHDSKRAVGVGVGLSKAEDGVHMLAARIVDPVAVMKVEYGVLKGFSVGIKNPRVEMGKADAPNGLVTGGDVIEVSVVDRPSNPECLFQMAKSDSAGSLALVDDPQVVEKSATYGLPTELFDRLAAPVKQALADLAAAGAWVDAAVTEPDEAAKADAPDLVPQITVKVEPPRQPHEIHLTGWDGPIAELTVTYKSDVQGVAVANADWGRQIAQAAMNIVTSADLDKAYTAEQKRAALKAGQAMPNADGDPSYVIKTKSDLRKAIKAVGRGSADHDDVRKHILTRAKALGLESMVPENWNADGSLKDAAKADTATIEKAEALLRDVRALVPDLAKADGEDGGGPDGGEDEAADITGAQEAIAAIAKLIVSEAESLAQGNLNEACDIALLLDAVRALKWFQASERAEQSGDGDAALMLADTADLLKAGGKGNLAPPFKKKTKGADAEGDAEDAADGEGSEDDDEKPPAKKKTAAKADGDEALLTKAEAADQIKAAVAAALAETGDPKTPAADAPQNVTKAELAEMVKTLVAEASAAEEERLKALTVDVAKASAFEAIRDLPQPGGPALTRTAAQQESALQSDSQALHAQAQALLAKAEAFSANRDLAEGYRQRAKALLAKAAA